jgi:hypothetical protein
LELFRAALIIDPFAISKVAPVLKYHCDTDLAESLIEKPRQSVTTTRHSFCSCPRWGHAENLRSGEKAVDIFFKQERHVLLHYTAYYL